MVGKGQCEARECPATARLSSVPARASNGKSKGQAMDYPIDIHIGAHRTGTSSFQAFLGLNRGVISGAGRDLLYPGRDGAEGGSLRLKLPAPRLKGGDRDEMLALAARRLRRGRSEGGRGMILSEENIPGNFAPFFKGQFYPQAGYRMALLRQVLPGRVRRVLLVVRPYEAVYVSAFRKRAEWRLTERFEAAVPHLMGMQGGWVDLARAAIEGLDPEALVVVPFAARGGNGDLLARLCPDLPAGLDLREPERHVNASFTDAGLWALRAHFEANEGKDWDRAEAEGIAAAHAGTGGPAFAAFSEAQSAELGARYARDLEALAALDRVEFAA